MKKLIFILVLFVASFSAHAFETLTGGKISTTAAIVNASGVIDTSNPLAVTVISGGGSYRGVSTDRSGTIAAAGVSQTLSALNANRVHFEIQANLANTTPLCFNFTAAASATANTRCLIAGATYNMDVPNFVSTELITVWSATAGAAWSAKEY
ncbi:MAG: hypothetical protein ABL856_10180 [Gallionella sp.]